MAATDLPDSDLFAKVPSRLRLLKRAEISTDTLDLDALFPVDIAGSGMFELKGHQESSLATLLDALPVCAFLIDHSQRIRMLNYRCRTICKERSQLKRTSFGSLFPLPVNASKARALIDRVLRERKAKIWEAQMELQGNRIWGRMHLRPLRMEGEIYVLLVLQDMTVERRQLYIIKKNERELRRWAAELEERVAKRTMELERVNAQLRMEIVERKSAQAALRRVNQELENRVAARTTELSRANEDLRREVEQRKQAQLELQQSSETVSALFNATTDVAYLVDTHGAILAVNKSFVFRYGGDPKALVGRRLQRVLPPELVARLTPKFLKVIRTGQSVRFELNFGGIISDDTFSPVVGSDGSVESVAVFSRDVTGRKHAEQKLSLAGKIIQSSNEGILVTDALGAIVDVNEAFCRLTGYSREEVIGQSTQMLQSDRHPAEFYQYMAAVLKNTGQWTGEVWGRRKNGEVYPKLLSMSAVRNRADKVTHYVGIITDITHIKRTEERLHRMAHFDPLTQLPNRVLFRSRLQQALVDSGRHKRTVALMLLDLDRFKHINDSLGHKAGDDLLDAVAKRLTGVVRKSDTVARLAGDEFTIILPEVSGAKAVASVARKIIDLFSAPFAIGGREVFVTASVGITLYPADGSQVDRLLRNADMALYGAKEQGKNTFQFFSEEMNREVLERLDLELAMRGALERNEFVVYYQPRLDCRTGRVSGLEALLRWSHPSKGLIFPDSFISVAEETGLIVPMGEWVLREACAQIKRWQLLGLPPLRVAVNVSARQFAQPDFAARAIQILNEEDVEPQSLELELTESAAMSNADATGQAFGLLKQHGIRICIDDFGTGYSCFSYLKRFSIDTLKIDKSFVEHVVSSSDEAALAETIIAIAHTLRMRVVAEGVESREQLDFFRDRGCDEWQGFYYCRPLPAEEAVHFMQGTAADSMASASVARLQQLVMGNGAGCLHEKSPSAAMEGIMPFHRKQT